MAGQLGADVRVVLVSASTLFVVPALAAPVNFEWKGSTSGWGTKANWLPASGLNASNESVLSFGSIPFTSATSNNDIAGTFTLNQINFAQTIDSASFTITGNALSFQQAPLGAAAAITQNTSFAQSISNGLVLAAPVTLGGAGSGVVTLSGSISGTSSLTKSGASTFVLSGNNSYSGTTSVTAGTLRVNGNSSSSAFNVSGGTLAGTGTVGSANVTGGTVAPGNSAGTLTTASLTLNSTATLHYELDANNTTAGSGVNDLTVVNGNLTLDGTLNISVINGVILNGAKYTLFTYTGTLTNNGLTLGTIPLGAGYDAEIDVATSGEVILSVVAVPEPSSLIAIGGLLGIIGFRRTRAS